MKQRAGVSVAHLALCKKGGLVDRSCVPSASRGNSPRRGVGSERQRRCDYWLLCSKFLLVFFYDLFPPAACCRVSSEKRFCSALL